MDNIANVFIVIIFNGQMDSVMNGGTSYTFEFQRNLIRILQLIIT
jgi:hypothetical protein